MDSLSLRDNWTSRQTDRPADDKQTGKPTDRLYSNQSTRHTGQQTDRQASRQTDKDQHTDRQTGQTDTHSSMFRVDTSQGITQRHTGGCGESGWAHSVPSHQAMLQHRHCTHAALQNDENPFHTANKPISHSQHSSLSKLCHFIKPVLPCIFQAWLYRCKLVSRETNYNLKTNNCL